MFLAVLAFLPLLSQLIDAKQKDFYTFKVVNIRGRLVSLEKYRGSVSFQTLERLSVRLIETCFACLHPYF